MKNLGSWTLSFAVIAQACGPAVREPPPSDARGEVAEEAPASGAGAGGETEGPVVTVGTATPADVAAPPPGAEVTPSGLASTLLRAGVGNRHPGPRDRCTVHYTGWTTDGAMFDSSVERGEPTTFPLDGVIAGWGEGVQLMAEGEIRRFWIPESLAYQGRPGRPAGMLVFDVELISFEAP